MVNKEAGLLGVSDWRLAGHLVLPKSSTDICMLSYSVGSNSL